jgi:hypothetical protein
VPDGSHEVVLRYQDPWVMRGLLLSAVAWIVLGAAWIGTLLVPTTRATPTPADAAPPR